MTEGIVIFLPAYFPVKNLNLEKSVGSRILAQALDSTALQKNVRLTKRVKLIFFQSTVKSRACAIIPRPTDLSWLKRERCLVQSISAFLLLLSFSQTLTALEKITIEIEQIKSNDWQLKNVSLSLSALPMQSQQLAASIRQVSLPEPFSDIKFFDIKCLSFSWMNNKIICQNGKAKLKSTVFHSSTFSFSFSITEKQSHFDINNLQFAKGIISLSGKQKNKGWDINLHSKNVQLKSLLSYFENNKTVIDEITAGQINADIQLQGNDGGINKLLLNLLHKNVSLQAKNGQIVSESLDFKIELIAESKEGNWFWQESTQIQQGELYIDPVYLKIEEALSFTAKGERDQQGKLTIQQANINHPEVVDLTIDGTINAKPETTIDSAHVSVNISDMDRLVSLYVSPFAEQTNLEGIKLQGQLQAEMDIKQTAVTQLSVDFSNLAISDDKKRIAMEKGEGEINWSASAGEIIPSNIRWERLNVKSIPIDSGQLRLLLNNNSIKLLEQSSIPLLNGFLDIKQFTIQKSTDDEPKVFFEGGVRNVSLEQLSLALDWTPLTGNISGYIPGVDYQNKKLTVDGELKVNVFDGEIKINKLASSGMFTDFSKFYMDMEIDNLDLYAITQKLKMGGMEGRISGFVNDLYLENWSPVTFYAWLGTPKNDDSRHRISQKAVENIASIGGGGAADVISKGFLRFFDTFGYDQIGFGCYLHQGVCQLMGVEAAEQGYYIIKGGGIPRIDIIGFNPQVDWNILIERLSRIATTDEIVIE